MIDAVLGIAGLLLLLFGAAMIHPGLAVMAVGAFMLALADA